MNLSALPACLPLCLPLSSHISLVSYLGKIENAFLSSGCRHVTRLSKNFLLRVAWLNYESRNLQPRRLTSRVELFPRMSPTATDRLFALGGTNFAASFAKKKSDSYHHRRRVGSNLPQCGRYRISGKTAPEQKEGREEMESGVLWRISCRVCM